MKLVPESSHLEDYLLELDMVDYNHPLIREKSGELAEDPANEIEVVRAAFEFVRDQISHSFDIKGNRVTCRASEVLYFGEGICYAKSNLLAAILRSRGIPAGFCYQWLTKGDTPDTGYCIHALNAVYLRTLDRWVRLDARGNKPGVNAQFSLDEEMLAFPIRPEYAEQDYPVIYKEPNARTIAALKMSSDCQMLYDNQPDQL